MKIITSKRYIPFLLFVLFSGFLIPVFAFSPHSRTCLSPISQLKYLLYQYNPSDIRDKASLSQKLNFLCSLQYAETDKEKDHQIEQLIYLVLDDFYWNRVLALHHLNEICLNNHIHDFSTYLDKVFLESASKKEVSMWMELLSSNKDNKEGILEASYRIHREEKQDVLSQLNVLLSQNIETLPKESLTFIIEESIQKYVLERENYIGGIQKSGTFFRSLSQWISFKLNKFGFFKSEFGGETQQRSLLAWQTLLDVVKIKESLIKRYGFLSTDLFLHFLSDDSIGTLLTPDYEKMIQAKMKELGIETLDPLSEDPGQIILKKMLIQMAIKVASDDHNHSEKGRTGALMVDPGGKILGISFNGPPVPDREHMGTEWAFDSIIPKTQKTDSGNMNENFSDIRERMDFKRSPCAEKKSIFQSMLKGRSPKDTSFVFVSRAPCYQCASVLKQENITAVMPEGLVEPFTSQFYTLIGFNPVEVPMDKHEMVSSVTPAPEKFNIPELIRILNNEQNSPEDSFQLHKIMNSLYDARLMIRKNQAPVFSRQENSLHLIERSS